MTKKKQATLPMFRPGEMFIADEAGAYRQAQTGDILAAAADILATTLQRGDVMSSPDATRRFLSRKLRNRPAEVFAALFLDNRHRLIEYRELFFGTIDGASVHPREVVRAALEVNAAAVIFAHNHPSGVAEPSRADEQITRRLKESLALMDTRVLDHMIVGEGELVSLAERGLI